MKTLKILILLLSINICCHGQLPDSVKIKYNINKMDDKKYLIDFSFTIPSKQRIVSPFSKDSIWIKTSITLQDSGKIRLEGHLIESPISKEEFDPIMERKVNFNRGHVVYTQKLELLSKQFFSIKGRIEYMVVTDDYAFLMEKYFSLIYDKLTLKIIEN